MDIYGYYFNMDLDFFNKKKEDISRNFLNLESDNLKGVFHLVYTDGKLVFGTEKNQNDFKEEAEAILGKVEGNSKFTVKTTDFNIAHVF